MQFNIGDLVNIRSWYIFGGEGLFGIVIGLVDEDYVEVKWHKPNRHHSTSPKGALKLINSAK